MPSSEERISQTLHLAWVKKVHIWCRYFKVISQQNKIAPPQGRLWNRAFRAGAWTLGSYGVELFVRLLSNLILTRLLFPEAFGAVAAAMALIYGLAMITDFGVRAVVIQSPRGDQVTFLRSAWAFQICRNVVIWIILVGLCLLLSIPVIRDLLPTASVFADRSFPWIACTMGLMVVLDGARSTSLFLNARHLNYKPIVIVNLAGRILSLPIMVTWAWLSPSVWALVGGSLVASLIGLILSHVYVPGPWMSVSWQKDHLNEIVRFGRWIAVSSVGTFVSQQFNLVLLGVLLPSTALGLYSLAKLLVTAGEGLLDQLNSSLALPIFGEVLRKDPGNLQDRYYRFRLPIELTAAVLSGGLFEAGQFAVDFLYDARYAQAGIMLQILALSMVIYPFLMIRNAFTATGDTQISAFISIMQACCLMASVVIGFFAWGTLGAIVGVALHRIFPAVVTVALAMRRNWIALSHELRIIPAFVAGVALGKGVVLIAGLLGLTNIHQILTFVRHT